MLILLSPSPTDGETQAQDGEEPCPELPGRLDQHGYPKEMDILHTHLLTSPTQSSSLGAHDPSQDHTHMTCSCK